MVGRKEKKRREGKRSRRHLLLTAGRECLSCIVVFHKPVPAINGIANSIRLMSTSPVIGSKRRKRKRRRDISDFPTRSFWMLRKQKAAVSRRHLPMRFKPSLHPLWTRNLEPPIRIEIAHDTIITTTKKPTYPRSASRCSFAKYPGPGPCRQSRRNHPSRL